MVEPLFSPVATPCVLIVAMVAFDVCQVTSSGETVWLVESSKKALTVNVCVALTVIVGPVGAISMRLSWAGDTVSESVPTTSS